MQTVKITVNTIELPTKQKVLSVTFAAPELEWAFTVNLPPQGAISLGAQLSARGTEALTGIVLPFANPVEARRALCECNIGEGAKICPVHGKGVQ